MINPNKLVSHIDTALQILSVHKSINEMALEVSPDHAPFIHQGGKNEGARQILEALKLGIASGRFDAAPDTIPAPGPLYYEDLSEDTEDMDDEAPEEAPVKFGVFFRDGNRSLYAAEEYDTRSEAWSAARKSTTTYPSILITDYEVRAL